jgi:hypothetical protein
MPNATAIAAGRAFVELFAFRRAQENADDRKLVRGPGHADRDFGPDAGAFGSVPRPIGASAQARRLRLNTKQAPAAKNPSVAGSGTA